MYGINYIKTFVLIIRRKILKIFFVITIIPKMTLLQINIISIFLAKKISSSIKKSCKNVEIGKISYYTKFRRVCILSNKQKGC